MKLIMKEPSPRVVLLLGENNQPMSLSGESPDILFIGKALVNRRCCMEDGKKSRSFMPSGLDVIDRRTRQLHWNSVDCFNVHSPGPQFSQYSELVAYDKKIREEDAVAHLMERYGYDIIVATEKKKKTKEDIPLFKEKDVSFTCFPEKMNLSGGEYAQVSVEFVRTPNGRAVTALVFYKSQSGHSFWLPARFEMLSFNFIGRDLRPYAIPGRSVPLYFLTNEDILAQPSTKTALLCASPTTAHAINRILTETKRDDLRHVIAAAPYGPYCETDWRGLKGKSVVFVPEPLRQGFHEAFAVAEFCRKADVADFRIVTTPVLCHSLQGTRDEAEGLDDPFERHCVKNSISLNEHESIIVGKIMVEALPVDAYEPWGVKVGLWAEKEEPLSITRVATRYQPPTAKELDSLKHEKIHVDIFASPKNIGAIIAPSHAGKTQAGAGLAVAWSAGVPFWGFESISRSKVLYIDAETEETRFKISIARQVIALGADTRFVEENLSYCCLRDKKGSPQDWDLSSPDFQLLMESEIKMFSPQLVIFDNLMNLSPNSGKIDEAAWNKIWQWMRDMEQKYAAAFLVIHHTNAEGVNAGTKNIDRQCSNIIFLTKGCDLVENKNGHSDTSSLMPYINKPGVLALVEVKKCRTYPEALNMRFGAFLAYDKTAPTLGGPWERIELEPRNAEAQPELSAEHFVTPDHDFKALYPDRTTAEYRILDLFNDNETINREAVDTLLECGRTKSGEILAKMVEDSLLDRIGNSVGTKYVLREK